MKKHISMCSCPQSSVYSIKGRWIPVKKIYFLSESLSTKGGEGEKELKEDDFKQPDVNCLKISLNKSFKRDLQNCPYVKRQFVFTTEITILLRQQEPRLHLKQTPNLRAVLQPSAISLAWKKNPWRLRRKSQPKSGLYVQWKYQKCRC